ncbi:ATP-binding cassette domain-containing protein [Nonomuraea jabiensis]|uniref:ATP-binding cassette domain-containing protein n=1 Tax=Nonomuraea jabiensis TaxID=882448 RepID=UPI003D75C74A
MSKNSGDGDRPAIEAYGLVKVYGEHRALDGIDLAVRRGQGFGLLGPNGAGKTTTIRILATPARPGGGARVLGHDVLTEADAIRARVAVTGLGDTAVLQDVPADRHPLLALPRSMPRGWTE